MLVQMSIYEVHNILGYEIEASNLYLMIGDKNRKSESCLFFRKNNISILRDRAQKTLEGIQNFYGLTSNNAVLRLYDKAKELLRPLISVLDENIGIYDSIKIDTEDNPSLSPE